MPELSFIEKTILKRDAWNRLLRAIYVAFGINLVTIVWPMVSKALDTGVYNWHAIGIAAVQVIGQGLGAYLLRRFGDGSVIPTPQPPIDSGQSFLEQLNQPIVFPPLALTDDKPKRPRVRPATKKAAPPRKAAAAPVKSRTTAKKKTTAAPRKKAATRSRR